MFNELYRRANRVPLPCKKTGKLSLLAAADAESLSVMFVNRAKNGRRIELDTAADLKNASVTLLDRSHLFQEKRSLLYGRTLYLPEESVLLLSIPLRGTKEQSRSGDPGEINQNTGKYNFAGLDD